MVRDPSLCECPDGEVRLFLGPGLALLGLVTLLGCQQQPTSAPPPADAPSSSAPAAAPAAPADTADTATAAVVREPGMPEHPPYSPDSVFRPNEHRSRQLELPPEALLARGPFTGDDTAPYSYFGSSVAIDGDRAVVGAPYADEGGAVDSGAAYVFRHTADGWKQLAKLTAPEPALLDHFGRSVAIAGSTVVVGAEGRDLPGLADAGAAYVFQVGASGAGRGVPLLAPEPRSHAAFGYAAAASTDADGTDADGTVTVAVGAPGQGSGAIHVFRQRADGWASEAELTVESLSARAGLGHALALDGDRLLVGAPAASGVEVLAGAAFLFERREGWQLVDELVPSERGGGDRLGRSVALHGELALVGAPRARVGDRTRAGRVWAFRPSPEPGEARWSPLPPIHGQPPRSDAELGRTLALGPGWAVIGSQFGDAMGQATGGALLFAVDADGLHSRGPLLAADAGPMHEFATSAAVGDDLVLVGAPRRGDEVDATGFVYTYSIEGDSE